MYVSKNVGNGKRIALIFVICVKWYRQCQIQFNIILPSVRGPSIYFFFSFLRCLTKPSANIFSPPCVPHALPISSSLIYHLDNILLSSTIQEAAHCALFCSLMLLPPS